MPNRVIVAEDNFPIQPSHINVMAHFWDSFGNMETEVSARWIIRFLKERGQGWAPFTYEEINAFYSQKREDGFTFNRLVVEADIPPCLTRTYTVRFNDRASVDGWIVKGDDGRYYVTSEFVIRCFTSSPAF